MDVDAWLPLLPEVTDDNRPYLDGCRAGQLRLQVCDACGTWRFPPSPVCPRCLSPAATWTAAGGRGRLWSWIVMHQRYFDAFADELPYLVAFVQLEEGPYMVSTLVGPPDDLQIDEPVEVVFEAVTEAVTVPKFRVVRGG